MITISSSVPELWPENCLCRTSLWQFPLSVEKMQQKCPSGCLYGGLNIIKHPLGCPLLFLNGHNKWHITYWLASFRGFGRWGKQNEKNLSYLLLWVQLHSELQPEHLHPPTDLAQLQKNPQSWYKKPQETLPSTGYKRGYYTFKKTHLRGLSMYAFTDLCMHLQICPFRDLFIYLVRAWSIIHLQFG